MIEHPHVERRTTLDFDNPQTRLQLVRDITAMANSGGGRLIIGVKADGTEQGIRVDLADKLGAEQLADLVADHVAPDRVAVQVERRDVAEGAVVVEIQVAAAQVPPLVLSKPGVHQPAGGDPVEVFPADAVVVRRGSRVTPARRDDFRRWTQEAVSAARAQIQEQLLLVANAPVGARIRVIGEDEVRDEPSYFLSRSSDLFQRRPERLLDSGDLAYLWSHRETLDLTGPSGQLVVQSALRKRATLFLWLRWLKPDAVWLDRQLWRVFDVADRDKSDAARSMLQVAALFLDRDRYEALRLRLSDSRYAHMREAAEDWPTPSQAMAAIEGLRDSTLAETSEEELFTLSDGLLAEGGQQVSRRALPIGLELLLRQQDRAADT